MKLEWEKRLFRLLGGVTPVPVCLAQKHGHSASTALAINAIVVFVPMKLA